MCLFTENDLSIECIYFVEEILYHKRRKMSIQRQSDWYGESPNLPSVVPATSEVEFETSLSSVYKVIMSLVFLSVFVN